MEKLTYRSSCDTLMPRYDPLNDFFFYKIMGEKGNEAQLLGFLNAVLGKTGDDKFTSVEILENKTFTPENIDDKSVTFDVRAVLQGSTRVNVEVQIRNKHNMDKRSLFHWSREFVKSLKAGQDFSELPNVIAINIVNFDYLNTRNFHSCFHLREDSERDIILTGALEIHFINMVRYRKLKGKNNLNNPLYRWLAWLNKNSPPEIVKEVIKMDESIQAADERLVYLSGDEDAIHYYERRFTAMCDETSERNYARSEGHKKGLQEGLKKGRKEGLKEVARKALAEGASIDFVQKITDLDIETLKNM